MSQKDYDPVKVAKALEEFYNNIPQEVKDSIPSDPYVEKLKLQNLKNFKFFREKFNKSKDDNQN